MSANCYPQCESYQQCFQNQCYNLCSLDDCAGGETGEVCKEGLCMLPGICNPPCSIGYCQDGYCVPQ